jgi:hypothetical protein
VTISQPELDRVADPGGVVARLERELAGSDVLLVGAGHPGLELAMPASLKEGRHREVLGGGSGLLGWRDEVEGVLEAFLPADLTTAEALAGQR